MVLLLLLGASLSLFVGASDAATQTDIKICEKDPNLEKAKKHCLIVLNAYPNPPATKEAAWRAAYYLGIILVDTGKAQSAISYFNKAIELFPRKTGGILGRGRAYAAIGKYKQAFADFNFVIQEYREGYSRSLGLGHRGLLYKQLGQHHKAKKDLRQAVIFGNREKDVQVAVKEYGMKKEIDQELKKRRNPNYGRMEALKKLLGKKPPREWGTAPDKPKSFPSKPKKPDFDLGDELDF